jgi:signal peptidase II
MAAMWALGIAFGVFIFDFITKSWVQAISDVDPFRLPHVLIHNFCGISLQITHASNTGAAWGVFADFPHALVIFRLLLIVALVIYFVRYNTKNEWVVPLALIIGGATGNVIDFFIYGYVIDMIQMNFWGYDYPVFNIADSAIFVGSLWLLVLALFEKKISHDKPPADST